LRLCTRKHEEAQRTSLWFQWCSQKAVTHCETLSRGQPQGVPT